MKKPVTLFLLTIPALICNSVFGQDKLGVACQNNLFFHIKDLPTSAAFYRDDVGLQSIPVPANLKAIRAWFDLGNGQQINRLDGRSEQINHDKNRSHFTLFVEDINKAKQ